MEWSFNPLQIHQKIHKKIKCQFCSESFDTKTAATSHEKTHAEEN